MADIPAGARLEYGPAGPRSDARAPWPVVVVRNVWVLPGVPSIFRRKFEAVRELFRAGADPRARRSTRAPARGRSPARSTRWSPPSRTSRSGRTRTSRRADYRVKITLDGRDARRASTARWPGWPRGWATPSSAPTDTAD